MLGTRENTEGNQPNPERRAHSRRLALSLVYVDLGASNGGILLNIAAGGIGITTAEEIREEHFSGMRFQLPRSTVRVEASGQIAWTSESKKEAGVRFVNLSEEAAAKINNWLSSEEKEGETTQRREDVHTSARRPFSTLVAAEPAASTREAVLPKPTSEGSIGPLFPGRTFTAALQRSRSPIATTSPFQTTDMADELRSALMRPILTAGMDVGGSQRRWWALAALVSLFAVISFVAGMAAGAGGWDGVLKLLSRKTTLASEPAQVADDAGRSAVEDAPAAVVGGATKPGTDSSALESQGPKAGSRGSAVSHSSGATTSARAGGRASQKDSTQFLLQSQQTPVSASSTVAITSRRSVQVAPEIAAQTIQEGQNVQLGQLIYHVEPFYPADAKQQGIEGTVEVHAIVGRDGGIRSIQTSSGPSQLIGAAINAVREWRYKPTLLNGQPIESDVDVKMTFRLPQR